MTTLYAVEFELEEFGQNVSHLTRKTYYTHDFFTDRQVYAGITRDFEFVGREEYVFKKVPCSLAIPLKIEKRKEFFSIKNVNLQKERATAILRYITEGNQEYLTPGSRFLAFSLIKPDQNIMFIGKKSSLARINVTQEVSFKEEYNQWTTTDLIYLKEYEKQKNREIFGLRLKDVSKRYMVGQFKVSNLIKTTYKDHIYRFYSLWKAMKSG